MTNKGNFLAGVAIMAGLIVSGAMIPAAVWVHNDAGRTVEVKGLCEREVNADKVIWPIKFKVVGDDLEAVQNEIDTKKRIIFDFLSNGGIVTGEIGVSIPTISDKFAQEYGSNDRTYRYVATTTVTVCTSDVDTVLKLMADQGELSKSGIARDNDWDCSPQFSFEGLNDLKPGMIQEATRNARLAAEKFAQDSGSSIGKIKTATQGTFSIEDRDSNTPQVKKVRVVTNVTYYLSN